MYFVYYFVIIVSWPFTRCKIRGKENIESLDEARVFVSNHYELYGPLAVFLNFPYKFRPWIIDKMMNKEDVEQQMGLMIYSNYKHVPRFLKTLLIKCVKNLVVFVMHHAKGISVSRHNIRANIETLKVSSETLEKGQALVIFPELLYTMEGVGEFQSGFEHIGRYHFHKTGKRVSFYPMFISKKYRTIYIGKQIKFDPNKDVNVQKLEIVNYLHDSMKAMHEEFELNRQKNKNKIKQKAQ